MSESAHYDVGRKAAENGVDAVFTYGERAVQTAKGASDGGVKLVRSFLDKEELSKELIAFLEQGDAVLFKASRGMKLEEVIFSVYEALEK